MDKNEDLWKVTSQDDRILIPNWAGHGMQSGPRYITFLLKGLSCLKQNLPIVSVHVG